MVATKYPPRRIPQSFRFQIYSVVSVTCNSCGHESLRASELLWEEQPGRELVHGMPTRVRMARDRATAIIEQNGGRIAFGTKSLYESTPFKIDHFISSHGYEGFEPPLRASINEARDRKAGAL